MTMLIKILREIINNTVWFLGLAIAGICHKHNVGSPRLAIVRTDTIGDFVLFIPALKYIKKKYKNFEIVLILQDSVSELAENCPYIDKIISFNNMKYRRDLFYKFSLLLRLFRERFSVCLYPIYSRERIGDEMVLWTTADEKIGWDTEIPNMTIKEKKRGDKAFTKLIKSNFTQQVHENERNKEFLKSLGMKFDSFQNEFWISEYEKKKVRNLWSEKNLYPKHVIAIIPCAQTHYRQWGSDKYKLIMKHIERIDKDALFIIIGSSAEKFILHFNKNDNFIESRVLNLCGETSLKELPQLFKRCFLAIGNETGPVHIAIATGVPTVCIIGGGHFGRFAPYGNPDKNKFVYKKMNCFNCGWRCIYPTMKCIAEITVDDVLTEVKELLSTFQKTR